MNGDGDGDENEVAAGLDQRIDQITDETLDCTRRILNVAEETNQIGVETLVALNVQGEKLDRVENRFDEMNVDLNKTDKNIREIEKVCGCCVCPSAIRMPRSVVNTREYRAAYGKSAMKKRNNPITKQPISVPVNQQNTETPEEKGGYVKRVTGDEREDEMDKNLQGVNNILDNLHSIAIDMGDELERQNDQLQRINKSAKVNDIRLDQTNYRLRQQLN